MDFQKVIKNCIKGNPRAQRELYENLSPKMMTVCLRYMENTEEAEDVFQMAFVKVFGKLKEFHFDGSFQGWVRRIFVNSCLDQIRKNKKTKYDVSVDDVEFKLEDDSFIFENMVAQELMDLIQGMPTGYKTVFNMFAIEGYSHKEIAEHLGVSESTSKSQYKRARSFLMNCLEEQGHE
jgi:RNA polymerase sigma factor (sigma-70 family)